MNQKQVAKTVYSTKERALLASLVEMFKDKLESKKTDSTTNAVKNEAWQIIAEQYNAHDVTARAPGQLKKCWENMKYKTRKADTQIRHSMLLTGGGPPEKDTSDVIDDMVRAIVPTINYSLKNTWDSTALIESDEVVADPKDDVNKNIPSTSEVQKIDLYENIPQVSVENIRVITENGSATPRQCEKEPPKISSSTHFSLKRKRISALDEEKELRIQKLRESIEQQKQLHALRMEAVEAEKLYWLERTRMLSE